MRSYQAIFAAAAAYNLTFGIWAALFPLEFFRLFALAPPRYPSIWACLGMVIGLYGVVYGYLAWKPREESLLVALGFTGKVLGPMGWLVAVWRGELPPRTFPLILANDLVWWFPFAWCLLRDVTWRRALVTWLCVSLNGLACVMLLGVRGGTEAVAETADRLRWVSQSAPLWTTAWLAWSLASMSLLAFFVQWSAHLLEMGAPRTWAHAACFVCAIGVLADLSGETVNIVWLTQPGLTVRDFERAARGYTLLGPFVANGLYCLAGLVLSGISWRVGFLRHWVGRLGFALWTVGGTLSLAAVFQHHSAMVVSGAATMILFVVWAAIVGWRLRPTGA